jgi:hypothetical protein
VANTTSPSNMTMQEMAKPATMPMSMGMNMPMSMMPMNMTMPMSMPMKMGNGTTNNIVLQNVTLYIITVQNVSFTMPSRSY